MNGFLDQVMNSGGVMDVVSRMIAPSYGGPVQTTKFHPAINTAGNIVNTGNNPGGLMVRQGAGGATIGAYGGGWAGPYNVRTGQYGMGGNYGFARPYQGIARGGALVTVPANWAPNSPNVTYPCPAGRGTGFVIAPGVPCGISVTALSASQLPTFNGMPGAMDISMFAVSVCSVRLQRPTLLLLHSPPCCLYWPADWGLNSIGQCPSLVLDDVHA